MARLVICRRHPDFWPGPAGAAGRDTLSAQHKVLHAGARLPTAPRRTMPPKDRYTCAPGKTNRPTTEQLLHLLLAGLFSAAPASGRLRH